jgi:hypothetical protein
LCDFMCVERRRVYSALELIDKECK